MVYRKDDAIEAWKTFVSTGRVLEDKVRPEIARSWVRCRAAGVNPWSNDFDDRNEALLREKRGRFARSLAATEPVMKFLMAMVGCNVSLMDGENFVFELVSPIEAYPRTFGTFMREEKVGTGNATIVAYERKPVRVDGFEHYRAIAQSYSGVSVPYLDAAGKYYGAMNMNSPFAMLPANALALCEAAVEISNELFRAGAKASALLATVALFRPLLLACSNPVLLVDRAGNVLAANAGMRPFCPDWESYPYASQSLGAYLARGTSVDDVLGDCDDVDEALPVRFRKGKSRATLEASLVRRRTVSITGAEPFVVLVFEGQGTPAAGRAGGGRRRAGEASGVGAPAGGTGAQSPRERAGRPASEMPAGDAVDYIGESEAWLEVDRLVKKVAAVKTNVLLLGETGTGKEVVARALHRRSGRAGEFVAVNCGALPRDLLATELFGYEGGAFTGAREGGAVGKFEFADGGTLFLDEIGEMPVDMQVSLLRVLQESSVTKLGSNTSRALDLRVIAATNQNIHQLIAEKKFRADLYYRLSMMEIHLPELRRRPDDIDPLVEYFNKRLSRELDVPHTPFPPETIEALKAYSWPGNVRELRNIVERCLIMQGEGAKVDLEALPPHIANAGNGLMGDLACMSERDAFGGFGAGAYGAGTAGAAGGYGGSAGLAGAYGFGAAPDAGRGIARPGDPALEDARRRMRDLVERCDGDLTLVARELGMSTRDLESRLEALRLRPRVVLEDADLGGGGAPLSALPFA